MKLLRILALTWLITAPVIGSATSITNQTMVTLHTGEALTFRFLTSSYQLNAPQFQALEDPARISFTFSTLPLETWNFEAELRSASESADAAFDGERLFLGAFAGVYYRGSVSNASGTLALSPDLSHVIFDGPVADLILRNAGADVVLGLPPYTLTQDMRITLSGGGFSVGAQVISVVLDPAAIALPSSTISSGSPAAPTPEPGTALMFAGGALLGAWRARRRIFGRSPRGRASVL